MRALVIGGSGFIGRNLARRLLNDGHRVGVLDTHKDTTGLSEVVFYRGDCQSPSFLDSVISDFKPEIVYHLAANSDIKAGVSDASLDLGDTLMTTVSLRQVISKSDVKQVVFASSSAIFGISEHAFSENTIQPAEPVSWYGKAKLASEYVLESLARECTDIKILIVRFPNVVGPFATHGVIFDFINKLRATPQFLQVLGDGKQDKPYVHVSDLIDGILFFVDRQSTQLERINLGPKDTSTVSFIAESVANAMNLKPTIAYQETPYGWVGDVPRYSFDTTEMNNAGFHISSTSNQAIVRAATELTAND